MPVAEPSLRDEYAAAAERVAGRALEALRGLGGAVVPATPLPRAELAAVRVLGPDVFAPWLLSGTGEPCEPAVLETAADARVVFPAGVPNGAADQGTSALAWSDWAVALLLARARGPGTGEADAPAGTRRRGAAPAPPEPNGPPYRGRWHPWSLRMAHLAPLALPVLDGPVHDAARRDALALARGAVRATLRRDHRTAARLARWLAWLAHTGAPCPVEPEPLLSALALTGDGSARTHLHLAIARRLSTGRRP